MSSSLVSVATGAVMLFLLMVQLLSTPGVLGHCYNRTRMDAIPTPMQHLNSLVNVMESLSFFFMVSVFFFLVVDIVFDCLFL